MRIYFNLRRDSCWDQVHPGKSKAKRKLFQVEFSGGSREGPGVPPPLFLDQTERPPPLLPSYLKVSSATGMVFSNITSRILSNLIFTVAV